MSKPREMQGIQQEVEETARSLQLLLQSVPQSITKTTKWITRQTCTFTN